MLIIRVGGRTAAAHARPTSTATAWPRRSSSSSHHQNHQNQQSHQNKQQLPPFDAVVVAPENGSSLAASLESKLKASLFTGKAGQVRLIFDHDMSHVKEFKHFQRSPDIISVVGVGKQPTKKDNMHIHADRIRAAAAKGINSIRSLAPSRTTPMKIALEPLGGNARATAEGAILSAYAYNNHKMESNKSTPVQVSLWAPDASLETVDAWRQGEIAAQAQNMARWLQETPANFMTPTLFAQHAVSSLSSFPNITINVHDKSWAESQKMGAFLSVARGSDEPLKFLEIVYKGDTENPSAKPIALVGKGVTFDTGGISIKPSADMALMKGDMGGAAVVLSTMKAIASLGIKTNVVAAIPLTENMPSGHATKPGDVVIARNGKSIEVDNTDAEGRLILADAIHYISTTHNPHTLVELSTLTGAINVALGYPFAGVFSSSDSLWAELDQAGKATGEGFWRMPLDDTYKSQILSNVADLKNVGSRGGGSCTAAIFLKEFVPGLTREVHESDPEVLSGEEAEGKDKIRFAHIDIASIMHSTGGSGFLAKGMTGRPTRAMIEFIESFSN